MKKKPILTGIVAGLLIIATLAFVPALTDFNTSQFGTTATKVSVKTGALTTNMSARGLSIPNATVSRALVVDAAGNATNASGTPDGTKFLNDAGAYATPVAGGQLATNGDQFAASAALAIKNGGLFTNLSIRGVTLPNVSPSLPAIINAHGDVTNAPGTADTTTFLRGDNTLAVPAYPAAADTTATDQNDFAIELFNQYSTGIPVTTNGVGWYGGGRLVGGQIVSRSISGYAGRTEKRLAITNGAYARTFGWGNQWKKLRIGVVWSMAATASVPVTNLYFGVCSGTNNTPYDASTTAFVGTANLNGAGSWVFNAGTDYPYFQLANFQNLVVRKATTSTNIVGGSVSFISSSTHTNRLPLVFEVSRTGYQAGVTYTVTLYQASNNQFSREADWNYRALRREIEVTVAGNNVLTVNMTSITGTSAFDENAGPLDTFVLTWDNPASAIELSSIVVLRLY